MQIEIDENREELFNNYYFEKFLKHIHYDQIKNFCSFEKLLKTNLNLISKKIIYFLSIFGSVIIFGLMLFLFRNLKK